MGSKEDFKVTVEDASKPKIITAEPEPDTARTNGGKRPDRPDKKGGNG